MRFVKFLRARASALASTRQERTPRWRIWAARVGLATALATALAYLPYRLLDGSGARKAAELRGQYERTVESCHELALENARLRNEVDALKNDATAIEDIAQSELGMVHPDDVIFRIERPKAATHDGRSTGASHQGRAAISRGADEARQDQAL